MNEPRAGRVRLDPTAFVAPGAVVLGEVTIGPRASVWFNTVVRGDVDTVEIGEASNVQDNSTVHVDAGQPVRIGARVTVGHRAIVHGCVIEDDCLIGMGSVLLSGCRIGAGSYLGASSLVLEGMQIPPGSVALGSPARVTGAVGERHQAGIWHGTKTYAALAKDLVRRGYARPVGRDGQILTDRQPMTETEWAARLEALERAPAYVQELLHAFRTGGPHRPPEIQLVVVMDTLRWLDRDARRPCVERLVRREEVWCDPPETRPLVNEGADLEPLLHDWREHRAAILDALRKVRPPEWHAIAWHHTRGPFTLAELIREWTEEDLEVFGRILGRRARA